MTIRKIPVGVLGATGAVGQRLLALIAGHPDFEVVALAGSDRSAGKAYGEASVWRLAEAPPSGLHQMRIRRVETDLPCEVIFSALDAETAHEVEPAFARAGYAVFSNAAAHRLDEDVPLLIPEVNADHACLLEAQRRRRGWSGSLVTNPNCSATQLALALAPLHAAFGVEKVVVTTMQAISGAGYPGVAAIDALGNIIPDIPGEALKIEAETCKILGRYESGAIYAATIMLSAHTYRVPVENGHTESVSVLLSRKAEAAEIVRAWQAYRGGPETADLPTAPSQPLEYFDARHEPQPRRHAGRGGGMVVSVGGLDRCSVLDWKFTVVGNNTVRGAAGACLMNAELLLRRGLLAGAAVREARRG